MGEEQKTSAAVVHYLFMFFMSVFLLTSSHVNATDTDASRARYEVTKGLVERCDLSIPDGFGVIGRDGKDYAWYGIGKSVLAVPFYLAGKMAGKPESVVSIMNQLYGAASAVIVFLFCILLGYSTRASVIASIFYGIGTIAWPLAKHPFDHTVETFFVLAALYCMTRYAMHGDKALLVLSAVSIGTAFSTRYTAILALPSLCVMLIGHRLQNNDGKAAAKLVVKDCFLFSFAFLPFIALVLWYNYYRFGSLFETGFSLMASRAGLDFFTGTPLLRGLEGFLVSPGKGFFYYSPVTLLFFFSLRSFFRRHRIPAIAFLCIIVLYPLLLAKNLYWHGDYAWGPRYLLAITPFFIIPACELFDGGLWKRATLRAAIYSLFVVSVAIQIAAVSVDFQKYLLALHFEDHVEFTKVGGAGMPTIGEPPADVYFDWYRSPIASQFEFIYRIGRGMRNYRYAVAPENASFKEKRKTVPFYNLYDFWWVYRYYLNGGDCSGFLSAGVLFLAGSFAFLRIRKVAEKGAG
jgi:hypothetical protein